MPQLQDSNNIDFENSNENTLRKVLEVDPNLTEGCDVTLHATKFFTESGKEVALGTWR